MRTNPETASAEELLAALAVRDVAPDDPRIVARLATDSDLAERWAAVAATIAELEGAAATATTEWAPSDATPRVDPMAAIRALRPANAVPVPNARRLARRALIGATLAAAALVLGWFGFESTHPAADPRLGGNDFALAPRSARWSDGEALRWQAVRGADWYRLELRPVTGTGTPSPTRTIPHHDAPGIAATAWLPTATERAALPARFEWRVIAFDSSDTTIATSTWAETWR